MTWESGATPVILINKTDLVGRVDGADGRASAASRSACPVHAISAKHSRRLDALDAVPGAGTHAGRARLVGRGQVHADQPPGRQRAAGARRKCATRDHRGRHTTTHRELIVLPGGALLIDTPGMRELQLWSADAGVAETFDDIAALAAGVLFRRLPARARAAVRGEAGGGGGPPAGRAARRASTSCGPSRMRSPRVRTSWRSRPGRSATRSAPAPFARSRS